MIMMNDQRFKLLYQRDEFKKNLEYFREHLIYNLKIFTKEKQKDYNSIQLFCNYVNNCIIGIANRIGFYQRFKIRVIVFGNRRLNIEIESENNTINFDTDKIRYEGRLSKRFSKFYTVYHEKKINEDILIKGSYENQKSGFIGIFEYREKHEIFSLFRKN